MDDGRNASIYRAKRFGLLPNLVVNRSNDIKDLPLHLNFTHKSGETFQNNPNWTRLKNQTFEATPMDPVGGMVRYDCTVSQNPLCLGCCVQKSSKGHNFGAQTNGVT